MCSVPTFLFAAFGVITLIVIVFWLTKLASYGVHSMRKGPEFPVHEAEKKETSDDKS
jgi:hypothetical protein